MPLRSCELLTFRIFALLTTVLNIMESGMGGCELLTFRIFALLTTVLIIMVGSTIRL